MTDFENWSHENRPENAWPPIGTPDAPFSGNIRAAGWIGGVFIDMPETDNVGLFGFVSADSSFDWITLSGAYIRGNDRVGGLFGSCESESFFLVQSFIKLMTERSAAIFCTFSRTQAALTANMSCFFPQRGYNYYDPRMLRENRSQTNAKR